MSEHTQTLREIALYLKEDAYAEQIARIERVEQEKTCLLTFMGQFSAGKSRLINNLLQRPLLPVHITETTALITNIRYGEPERMELTREGEEAVETRPLSDAAGLWQSGGENLDNVRLMTLYVNSPLLKNGLILVDTPGINTIIQKHAEMSASILSASDRIVYVMGKSLTDTDAAFLQSVRESGLSILFVRTHMDCLRQSEEDAERTVQQEREALAKWTDEEIFFLSNEPESPWFRNVNRLQAFLSVRLAERIEESIREIILQRVAFFAGKFRGTLRERQARLSGLMSEGREAFRREKQDLEASIEKLDALLEKYREELRRKYEKTKRQALAELPDIQRAETVRAKKKIDGLRLGADPSAYVSPVEAVIRDGCFQMQSAFLEYFNQMLLDNRKKLEAGLAGFDGLTLADDDVPETLDESDRETEELLERTRALVTLRKELGESLAEMDKAMDRVEAESQRAVQERDEISAALEAVNRQLREYPPYIERRIQTEGTHSNEAVMRNIGRMADIATILIPGPTWLKLGEKLTKGLKITKKTANTAQAIKSAKWIDTALDFVRLKDKFDAGRNSSKSSKKRRDSTPEKSVSEQKDSEKKRPGILDYISLEHWLGEFGRGMDTPTLSLVDEEYLREYQEGQNRLMKEAYAAASAEAEKQTRLLDIQNRREQLAMEKKITERKLRSAEKEIAELKSSLEEASNRAKAASIREYYGKIVEARLSQYAAHIRADVSAQVDQTVSGYLNTYNARISAKMTRKRERLSELEKEYQQGSQGALEADSRRCQTYLKKLDAILPENK